MKRASPKREKFGRVWWEARPGILWYFIAISFYVHMFHFHGWIPCTPKHLGKCPLNTTCNQCVDFFLEKKPAKREARSQEL